MKCESCDCEMSVEFLVRAPESAWPMLRVCRDCVDDLVDDDDYRTGPECAECRDSFCRSCV